MVEAEASYGAAPTMVLAEDGVLVLAAPEVDGEWVNDGDRGVTVRGGGKSGLSGSVDLVTEAFVATGAFSSSVTPPNIHDLMQASGHIATLDATPAAENYIYTPNSLVTDWTSVGAEVYIDGEKNILTGGYSDLVIESDSGEIPQWTFGLMGILAVETDLAVPAIVYSQVATQPMKAVNMTITIGDYLVAVVRSFRFAKNNTFDPRVDEQTADLHKGFVGVLGTPTLELSVERTALQATPFHKTTGLNPRELEKAATAIPITLEWGSALYGKVLITATLAELMDWDASREGNISTWDLTFALQRSTPTAADAYSIKQY